MHNAKQRHCKTHYNVRLLTCVLPDLKMLGRWPRLMWGKRKNGRRQPTIAKQRHPHIKLENECLSICQLQRPPKPTSLPVHSMGHTVSLLCTIPELKSDQLIDHKRMLFVWHLIDFDSSQTNFLTPSGHGSHESKKWSQRIHLLLRATWNDPMLQTHQTVRKNLTSPPQVNAMSGKDVCAPTETWVRTPTTRMGICNSETLYLASLAFITQYY